MLPIGLTIRSLRKKHELTQRELADRLGVTVVHVCNVENGKSSPSPELIEKFQKLWGVDLYVLAWCQHGDTTQLPKELRKAANDLVRAWREIAPDLFLK